MISKSQAEFLAKPALHKMRWDVFECDCPLGFGGHGRLTKASSCQLDHGRGAKLSLTAGKTVHNMGTVVIKPDA